MSMLTLKDGQRWKPIPFTMDPDRRLEIMEQTARQLGSEMDSALLEAFPDYRLPGTRDPDASRKLAFYTKVTAPEDFPMLRDPKYLDLYRAGLMPGPSTPPDPKTGLPLTFWLDLIPIGPGFRFFQADFRRLFNRMVGNPDD